MGRVGRRASANVSTHMPESRQLDSTGVVTKARLGQLDSDGKDRESDHHSRDFQCDLVRDLVPFSTPRVRIEQVKTVWTDDDTDDSGNRCLS